MRTAGTAGLEAGLFLLV